MNYIFTIPDFSLLGAGNKGPIDLIPIKLSNVPSWYWLERLEKESAPGCFFAWFKFSRAHILMIYSEVVETTLTGN